MTTAAPRTATPPKSTAIRSTGSEPPCNAAHASISPSTSSTHHATTSGTSTPNGLASAPCWARRPPTRRPRFGGYKNSGGSSSSCDTTPAPGSTSSKVGPPAEPGSGGDSSGEDGPNSTAARTAARQRDRAARCEDPRDQPAPRPPRTRPRPLDRWTAAHTDQIQQLGRVERRIRVAEQLQRVAGRHREHGIERGVGIDR